MPLPLPLPMHTAAPIAPLNQSTEQGEINTPASLVRTLAEELAARQPAWSQSGWTHRQSLLTRLHGILTRDADAWVDLIVEEIGKPRIEAETEVLATLDAALWTIRKSGRLLRDQTYSPGWQRWLLMTKATVHHRPYGLIGMIGTWNYPLLLNAGPIFQALATGNSVIWKPSEFATRTGKKLQDALTEAGLAPGVAATVYGGPLVGQALISAPLRKAVFTGGTTAGRRVLADLAARGIPALAELSGYDAAIVQASLPVESTVPALAWGAFVGAGQTCVAIKRIYVVGDPKPWAEALGCYADSLTVGAPSEGSFDLGPLISIEAKRRFLNQVQQAIEAGAQIMGQKANSNLHDGAALCRPYVLLSESPKAEHCLEGIFGPVVVVRGVPDLETAISAVNSSEFGLAASLWGHNTRELAAIAPRLDVGMVTINDAVTAAGHMTAPFGGLKASGFGRTRGEAGLMEFVQPQAVHQRRPGGFRPQLYPYQKNTPRLFRLLRVYKNLFHRPARSSQKR